MLCIADGKETGTAAMENGMTIPKKKNNKTKQELPYAPASLLGIYPREVKTNIQTNTRTFTFIAAVFT